MPILRLCHRRRIIASVTKPALLKPLAVFDSPPAVAAWYPVNDDVMGGRSSGGPCYEAGNLVFSGNINTDGGGFSSIRAPLQPGALAGKNCLVIRVRTDARAYQVSLRTDVTVRGMSVAFRGEIDASQAGEWVDCKVLFADLVPTIFGRPIDDAVFERDKVTSIGFIISDKTDGPFELAIASIHAG